MSHIERAHQLAMIVAAKALERGTDAATAYVYAFNAVLNAKS